LKWVRIQKQPEEDADTFCPLYRFLEDNLESLSPGECYYINTMDIGIALPIGVHFGWAFIWRVEDEFPDWYGEDWSEVD